MFDEEKCFIIAEVGNNHEGDFGIARELILRAAETGVDAVKFQTFIPAKFTTINDYKRQETLEKFRLTFDQFAELSELSKAQGLRFISTPLDLESAAFLEQICDAIKIASGDITFYPLLRRVAMSGLPVIASTGAATLEEIDQAIQTIENTWASQAKQQGSLGLLHCVSNYPVAPNDANLGAISEFKRRYPDKVIGYSDHTIGRMAALVAVALGAKIIEKHFTLDRNFSNFRDHALSADPKMMADLVSEVRDAEALMGPGKIQRMSSENEMVDVIRRSIVAARDLPAGSRVQWEDLDWVRPAGGLPPGCEDDIIGKSVIKPIKQGNAILQSDLSVSVE